MNVKKVWLMLAAVMSVAACGSTGEVVTVDALKASGLAREMLRQSDAFTRADAEKFQAAFAKSLPTDATAKFWDLRELPDGRFALVFSYESRDLVQACVSFVEPAGWVALPNQCSGLSDVASTDSR